MRIGTDIYEDDRLDAESRQRLEAEFAYLHRQPDELPEKIAAGGLDPEVVKAASVMNSAMRRDLLHTALTGAASGAALFGAGLAGHGLVQGSKRLGDKVSRGRDLKKIVEVYPELKSYPQNEIDLAYNSMRHLNPHFARDPLVGGTMLKQILRSRDPSNPKSLRFEGGLAVDLAKSRPRESDVIDRMAVDAFQGGVQAAMRDREVRSDRQWRQTTDAAKRDADQAFRSQQARAEREFKDQQRKQQNEFQTATERLKQRAQKKRDLTQHRRAVDLQRMKGRQGAQQTVLKKEIDDTTGYGQNTGPWEAAQDLRSQGALKDILK